jgi:hypothetical protein
MSFEHKIMLSSIFLIAACASSHSARAYSEIGDAWRMLENSENITAKLLDDAIAKIRPYLEVRNGGLALTMGLIFKERALSKSGAGNEAGNSDYLCYLKLLERSSDFGDVGAASSLASEYHFGSEFLEQDEKKSACWSDVAGSSVESLECAHLKIDLLDVCYQ